MKKTLLLSLAVGLSIGASVAVAQNCKTTAAEAQVSAVYPTADVLPENLLRFYVYFSMPMKRENILNAVYLADSDVQKLEGVFLDNRFDLWSPDSTRLTLLFDPGRVKTGLVAHNAMGRALKSGHDYQLIIDSSAMDAGGCAMASGFKKTFTATAADDQTPDPNQWMLSQPQEGTTEALTVDFNGPMDHVSLAYRIRVKDGAGQTVPGRIGLAHQEKQWIFIPDASWGQTPYTLSVNPILEDLAGNRIAGLFDQPSLVKESQAQKQWLSLPVSLGQ